MFKYFFLLIFSFHKLGTSTGRVVTVSLGSNCSQRLGSSSITSEVSVGEEADGEEEEEEEEEDDDDDRMMLQGDLEGAAEGSSHGAR